MILNLNLIKVNQDGSYSPNINYGYGPYSGKTLLTITQELGDLFLNGIPEGLTIAIKEGDSLTEYWYMNGSFQKKINLETSDSPTILPVVTSVNYSVDLRNDTIILDDDSDDETIATLKIQLRVYSSENGNITSNVKNNITIDNDTIFTFTSQYYENANDSYIEYTLGKQGTLVIDNYSVLFNIPITTGITYTKKANIIVNNISNGEIYELKITPDIIKRNAETGVLPNTTVVFKTYKIKNGIYTQDTNGITYQVKRPGDSGYANVEHSYLTLTNNYVENNNYVYIKALKNGLMVDEEQITIIKDGKTGQLGNPGNPGDTGPRGKFQSRVFCRTNADISSLILKYGTYDSPVPTEVWIPATGSNPSRQINLSFTDGIPSGTSQLWAATAWFEDDENFVPSWSFPAREADTEYSDIEFNDSSTPPSAPTKSSPNDTNPTNNNNGWVDAKDLDSNTTYIWRAERNVKNGEYVGDWVITKIYAESGSTTTGEEGNGISSIDEYYAVSNLNTNVTYNWSDFGILNDSVTSGTLTWYKNTIPAFTNTNKYLWNFEVITYTKTTQTHTSAALIGSLGENGKGISRIEEWYLASNVSTGITKENITNYTWKAASDVQLNTTNKYLWNYEKIVYTDNTETITDPVVIGVDSTLNQQELDAIAQAAANEVVVEYYEDFGEWVNNNTYHVTVSGGKTIIPRIYVETITYDNVSNGSTTTVNNLNNITIDDNTTAVIKNTARQWYYLNPERTTAQLEIFKAKPDENDSGNVGTVRKNGNITPLWIKIHGDTQRVEIFNTIIADYVLSKVVTTESLLLKDKSGTNIVAGAKGGNSTADNVGNISMFWAGGTELESYTKAPFQVRGNGDVILNKVIIRDNSNDQNTTGQFNNDGSGFLASGNLNWDSFGNLEYKGVVNSAYGYLSTRQELEQYVHFPSDEFTATPDDYDDLLYTSGNNPNPRSIGCYTATNNEYQVAKCGKYNNGSIVIDNSSNPLIYVKGTNKKINNGINGIDVDGYFNTASQLFGQGSVDIYRLPPYVHFSDNLISDLWSNIIKNNENNENEGYSSSLFGLNLWLPFAIPNGLYDVDGTNSFGEYCVCRTTTYNDKPHLLNQYEMLGLVGKKFVFFANLNQSVHIIYPEITKDSNQFIIGITLHSTTFYDYTSLLVEYVSESIKVRGNINDESVDRIFFAVYPKITTMGNTSEIWRPLLVNFDNPSS